MMLLHAITDRRLSPGDEPSRCAALLDRAERWAQAGVGVIHLREKDLPEQELEALTRSLVEVIERSSERSGERLVFLARPPTLVLLSARPAVARRAGAQGVHLASAATAGASLAARMRETREAWGGGQVYVSVACHSAAEAREARELGASEVVFAPVFEKPLPGRALAGAGLDALQAACEAAGEVPVVALGGVTLENAAACVAAGAAGVAGIRLFAGEHWRLLALQR